MSLANISPLLFLLGLLVVAGLLFLLQRLRVKYRDVEVVTTLFWKQAIEESRARVLVRKFRHPWAYLLALAIGALLWLAVAEPQWDRDDAKD
ncbi:MAG: BatA domain-containing protein, partial [Verrucomicrobiota bacterium]